MGRGLRERAKLWRHSANRSPLLDILASWTRPKKRQPPYPTRKLARNELSAGSPLMFKNLLKNPTLSERAVFSPTSRLSTPTPKARFPIVGVSRKKSLAVSKRICSLSPLVPEKYTTRKNGPATKSFSTRTRNSSPMVSS